MEAGLWVYLIAPGAFSLPALGVLAWFGRRRAWISAAWGISAGLIVIYGVNFATVLGAMGWGATEWFVAMNLGFLGNALGAVSIVRLGQALVGNSSRGPVLFMALATMVFWLIGLYQSLLLPERDYGQTFTWGTLLGALGIGTAAVLLFRHRGALGTNGRLFLLLAAALVCLGLASAALDLWSPGLPLSPIFLALGSASLYTVAFHEARLADVEVSFLQWCRDRGISDREREVLELLVAGLGRQEIAERLFISPVTVKNHLAALYRKTQTSDQATLVHQGRINGAGPSAPLP